jgi:hypothetical protein
MAMRRVAIILVALTVGAAVWAQGPPADPLARQTWRAERLAQRTPLSPEARATRRAQREHERALRPPRPMELRAPLPVPVALAGGTPAGGACAGKDSCKLDYQPRAGEALVVTAVWSATHVECDGLTLGATPPGGAPISPWWRCQHSFRVEGKGAGYVGFVSAAH